jgi:hypothetical protein
VSKLIIKTYDFATLTSGNIAAAVTNCLFEYKKEWIMPTCLKFPEVFVKNVGL